MNIINKVTQLKEEYEIARKNLCEELKPEFHNLFSWLLEKYSFVDSIYFTAYTPYFNDGETCEFRVNDLNICLDAEYSDDEEMSPVGYGPNYKDILIFLQSGEVTPDLYEFCRYYLEPRKILVYNGYNKEISPKYVSVEEFLEEQYPWVFVLTKEQIAQIPMLQKDFESCESTLTSIPEEIIQEMFGDHIKVIIKKNELIIEEYEHE